MSEPLEPLDTVGYEPPESLWQFIKSIANECELDEIKHKIGESLVEESLDLHNEIDSLLEIWRDYRNETEQNLYHLRSSGKNKLLEPANVRNTLKKEIELFFTQLKDQYKMDTNKFNTQILKNNHNLNVINYVLNVKCDEGVVDLDSNVERPRTSRSRLGFDTPALNPNRPKTRLTEDIENIPEDKINFIDIDTIVEKIRELLLIETEQLKSDIEFLMEVLDEEQEYRLRSNQLLKEPSIYELKEERKRLESDLLSCKNLVKISKLPQSVSAINSNRSINSPVMSNRASPPGSASSNRSTSSVKSVRSVSKPGQNRVLIKPSIVNTQVTQTVSKLKLDLMSRNNSVSSIDLTSSSSSSMTTAKTNSVQKFRQMVLDSRD